MAAEQDRFERQGVTDGGPMGDGPIRRLYVGLPEAHLARETKVPRAVPPTEEGGAAA